MSKDRVQVNIRITDEMKKRIKATGYSASEFGRIAIERQFNEMPVDLQIKEEIINHDIEQYEDQIIDLQIKINKKRDELEEIHKHMKKYQVFSDKIKLNQEDKQSKIDDILITVDNMIYKHECSERYEEVKTKCKLYQDTLDFFARKSGLRKDELIDLFIENGLDE